MESWQISFLSALLGAIVGGLMTAWASDRATKITYNNTNKIAQKQQLGKIVCLLEAISTEMASLWELHQESVGHVIESTNDDTPIEIWSSSTQDYFAVYHGNTSSIGEIENSELRQLIIQGYAIAMGLTDALNHYYIIKLKYQSKFKEFEKSITPIMKGDENFQYKIDKQHLDAEYEELVYYSKQIKTDHAILNEIKDKTLLLCKNEITKITQEIESIEV